MCKIVIEPLTPLNRTSSIKECKKLLDLIQTLMFLMTMVERLKDVSTEMFIGVCLIISFKLETLNQVIIF